MTELHVLGPPQLRRQGCQGLAGRLHDIAFFAPQLPADRAVGVLKGALPLLSAAEGVDQEGLKDSGRAGRIQGLREKGFPQAVEGARPTVSLQVRRVAEEALLGVLVCEGRELLEVPGEPDGQLAEQAKVLLAGREALAAEP